jgi:hypothetical protein
MLRTATQKGRLIVVVGSVVAAAAGAAALRADLLAGYGLSEALGGRKPVPPFELVTDGSGAEPGDEIYWLSRTGFEGPVATTSDPRLAAGDRLTIPGPDGRPRRVEVVSVRVLATPLVKVAAGGAHVPLLMVTGRVLNPTKPGSEELVRFVIETEEPKPPTLPATQDGRT